MNPISYETFLANVTVEDLAMMTTFSVGQRAKTLSPDEAAVLRAQADRLLQSGMLWRYTIGQEPKAVVDGVLQIEYQFDGWLDPVGAGYLSRAVQERVRISRIPLPPEVQTP